MFPVQTNSTRNGGTGRGTTPIVEEGRGQAKGRMRPGCRREFSSPGGARADSVHGSGIRRPSREAAGEAGAVDSLTSSPALQTLIWARSVLDAARSDLQLVALRAASLVHETDWRSRATVHYREGLRRLCEDIADASTAIDFCDDDLARAQHQIVTQAVERWG